MRLYTMQKICLPLKLGQAKEKIKIDGTRVLKACESGHRHSILVREIDNFDRVVRANRTVLTGILNGMIDIGNIDHWGKVSCRNYTDVIIDRLNIDNGNAYHTEEGCKGAHERKLQLKPDCEKRQR